MIIEREEKATLDAKIAAVDAKLDKVTNCGRGWYLPALDYPNFKSSVPPADSRPIGQVVRDYCDKARERMDESDLVALGYSPSQIDSVMKYYMVPTLKEAEIVPLRETDKPIGTRDVDKFLREQQDKLWRDE